MLALFQIRFVMSMVAVRLAEYPNVVRLPPGTSAPSASLKNLTTNPVDDNVCAIAVGDMRHALVTFAIEAVKNKTSPRDPRWPPPIPVHHGAG